MLPEKEPALFNALSYETPIKGISARTVFVIRSTVKYRYIGTIGSNVDMFVSP
jgi:hypothetical protein